MADTTKSFEFSLKAMINKEKGKVLFVEAGGKFVDFLFSFLASTLGPIFNVLYQEDEAFTIGSLSSMYRSMKDLDGASFVTEGARDTLLNPMSYRTEHEEPELEKGSQPALGDKGFTSRRESFVISDDLVIFPNVKGIFSIIATLGITDMDMDEAEPITLTIGSTEMRRLVKASFVSPTPLSDVLLDKTVNKTLESEPMRLVENEIQANPNSKSMILKAMVQKSSGKLLYAQVEEDFVEFLFSFFRIPLGAAEHLVGGETGIKAIDNLYRSVTELIDDKYFDCPDLKDYISNPNPPLGCFSKDYIFLPLIEKCLPSSFSSSKFPKGQGKYLDGPRTYQVGDDLSVAPFCIVSILSRLRELKIPLSDVEEVELEIGLKEVNVMNGVELQKKSGAVDNGEEEEIGKVKEVVKKASSIGNESSG